MDDMFLMFFAICSKFRFLRVVLAMVILRLEKERVREKAFHRLEDSLLAGSITPALLNVANQK